MSHLTPNQVLATPAGELAERSSESLFQLKNDAADLLAAAKAIVEHVDRALDLRYAQRAHQLRLAAGKDKGLREVFSNVADQITLGEMIAAGHLVPPRTFVIDVGVRSQSRCRIQAKRAAHQRSVDRDYSDPGGRI